MTELDMAKAALERAKKCPEENGFKKSLKKYELTRLRKKIEDLEKKE